MRTSAEWACRVFPYAVEMFPQPTMTTLKGVWDMLGLGRNVFASLPVLG